jgi:WD40 repeat protein
VAGQDRAWTMDNRNVSPAIVAAAAEPYLRAFSTALWPERPPPQQQQKQLVGAGRGGRAAKENKEDQRCRPATQMRECWGHKERILGCALSPKNGSLLATASQDGTVRIWDTKLHKQIRVLKVPSSEDELLRVAWHQHANEEYLATGGADGWVHIYDCNNDWSLVASIDQGSYLKPVAGAQSSRPSQEEANEHENDEDDEADEEDENVPQMGPPQIYALQFIKEWKDRSKPEVTDDDDEAATTAESVYLLTSADDFVILWELNDVTKSQQQKATVKVADADDNIHPREAFSLQFTDITPTSYGVSRCHLAAGQFNLLGRGSTDPDGVFGGVDRNPNSIIFVFDAAFCAVNGLLGVALSDGSLRVMNGHTGICQTVLTLPDSQAHLTSFCWDSTGRKIATALATGHVIVWSLALSDNDPTRYQRSASSCQAVYHGGHCPGRPVFGVRYMEQDQLLLTWGVDGRLCLWDGTAIDAEIDAPLAVLLDNDEYPIYGVDIIGNTNSNGDTVALAVAGGGATPGFLGIPVYVQQITTARDEPAIPACLLTSSSIGSR